MDTITLDAQTRDIAKKANDYRRDGFIPAVYYGPKKENMNLIMDYQTFRKVFEKAGSNTVLELKVDGKDTIHVLVHDIDYHPVKDTIDHVDFMFVDLNKEVTTEVPLEFVGESAAVRELGGTLTENRDEVMIKCMARIIPKFIEVDISPLIDFKSSIHFRDLILPEGVELIDDENVTIVTVSPPKAEEEPEEIVAEEGAEETGEAKEGAEKAESKEENEGSEKSE